MRAARRRAASCKTRATSRKEVRAFLPRPPCPPTEAPAGICYQDYGLYYLEQCYDNTIARLRHLGTAAHTSNKTEAYLIPCNTAAAASAIVRLRHSPLFVRKLPRRSPCRGRRVGARRWPWRGRRRSTGPEVHTPLAWRTGGRPAGSAFRAGRTDAGTFVVVVCGAAAAAGSVHGRSKKKKGGVSPRRERDVRYGTAVWYSRGEVQKKQPRKTGKA